MSKKLRTLHLEQNVKGNEYAFRRGEGAGKICQIRFAFLLKRGASLLIENELTDS